MTEYQYRPYKADYSDYVQRSMLALVESASQHGLGNAAVDALTQLNSLLEIYPQFGEPLMTFAAGAQRYIGCVGDVFVDYIVHEEHRLVWVVIPVKAMPHGRFDYPPVG